VTLTCDHETGAHYCHGVRNLPTNYGVSRTFRSGLIGQQLLDGPCDLDL